MTKQTQFPKWATHPEGSRGRAKPGSAEKRPRGTAEGIGQCSSDCFPAPSERNISRLESITYPRICQFATKATPWDCLHQRTGRLVDGSPVLDGAAHFDIKDSP